MVGLPLAVELIGALTLLLTATGGVIYQFVILPIKRDAKEAQREASNAMSEAKRAASRAETAEETAEDVADRVDTKLDDIESSLESIHATLAEQAREARGRSYTMSRLIEAIRQSENIDTDSVPHVDEDEFLRGGDYSARDGDD